MPPRRNSARRCRFPTRGFSVSPPKPCPNCTPDARKASVSDLLALVVRTNPADPRRQAARYASFSLFSPFPGARGPRSILAQSLDGVDRAKLVPAVQSLLTHEDSVPRAAAGRTFKNLTDHDLVALLPDIARAIEKIAPSNEMFGDGVRLAGLDLLSRLGIREGMALCVSVIRPDRWGSKDRIRGCLNSLQDCRQPRKGSAAEIAGNTHLPGHGQEGQCRHARGIRQSHRRHRIQHHHTDTGEPRGIQDTARRQIAKRGAAPLPNYPNSQ